MNEFGEVYEGESCDDAGAGSEPIAFDSIEDAQEWEEGAAERVEDQSAHESQEVEDVMKEMWNLTEGQAQTLLDMLAALPELSSDKVAFDFLDAHVQFGFAPSFDYLQALAGVALFLNMHERKNMEEINEIIKSIPPQDLMERGSEMIIEAWQRGQYAKMRDDREEAASAVEEISQSGPTAEQVRQMIPVADKITASLEEGGQYGFIELTEEESAIRDSMQRMLFDEVYQERLKSVFASLPEDASYRQIADTINERVLSELPPEYDMFNGYGSALGDFLETGLYSGIENYENSLEVGDQGMADHVAADLDNWLQIARQIAENGLPEF